MLLSSPPLFKQVIMEIIGSLARKLVKYHPSFGSIGIVGE